MTAVRFMGRDGHSKVSVRVMLPAEGQEVAIRGMQRDVEALRELGSGNMPRVLHQDFSGAMPWIASDAASWERAERHIEARGRPMSEKELLRFLDDTGKTIAPLHERGLAHRGIRAESVYFKEAGGQAALALPAWEADLERQAPDLFKSPYEAPEYLPGRATARTDMYALGVTSLRLLTGMRGPSLAAAARNPEAHKDRFGLTKGTFDILCALLAQSTAKRVSSAGQLLDLLAKLDPSHQGSASTGSGTGGLGRTAGAAAAGAAAGLAAGSKLDGPGNGKGAGAEAGEAADRHAEHLREKEEKQEELKKKGGWAALLALLLAVPALLRRVFEQAAAAPGFQIKLLVAMGLSAAAIGAGGLYASRHAEADSLRRPPIPHALPSVVVGQDDRAVPVAPDPGLWAKLMALLPKPATANRPAQVAGNPAAGSTGNPAPGSAGVPPAPGQTAPGQPGPGQPGQPPGAEPGTQPGTSPGAAGVPPAAPGNTNRPPGGPPDQPQPDPARPKGAEGPYDPVAEPGTDPEDASGLTKQSRFFVRVNKTYKTLTLYQDGQYVTQYIVAIGAGANTPDGRYTVKKKIANPSYENVPPGDGRNPLGTRWLGMDVRYPGGRSIGIHGTNNDSSIGQAVSGGCIRMKNADAEQLYDLIPEGTPVEIN